MKFIGIKEVCDRVGLSRTQITGKDDNGEPRIKDFPEAFYEGYRRLYVEEEIIEWQRKRLENRNTTVPKRERKPAQESAPPEPIPST